MYERIVTSPTWEQTKQGRMIKNEPPQVPDVPATAITRRGLLGLAGASAALNATPLIAQGFGKGFTHSVASGEPKARQVLLWTRYVAQQETVINFEVSETADFSKIAMQAQATASPDRDWCVKASATSLEPNTWYYYRFIAPDGEISPVGRTRTLPEGKADRFRLAVFSCANFGFGWFNAYAHATQANDADLAVHLGDYIYEYGEGTYPSGAQRNTGRPISPDDEIVTLADYRLRYATYRNDPDLQRLHQVLPMIAVWDDHESTNDSWKDGAQNHQSDTEGEWVVRKALAKRVYREWMPVTDAPYASYDVGDLATLFRLDTRLEGREEQFNLGDLIEGKADPQAAIAALEAFRDGEYSDPERQLLGKAQEQWLSEGLAQSQSRGATWQVLVQQVLMGRLKTPQGLVDALPAGLPEWITKRFTNSALASEAGLPANMDAWDGYPAARERVLKSALDADANLLVLAGDTHNCWAFELDQAGTKAGVELGVCGVTSPGLERSISAIPPADLAAAIVGANDQMKWADTSQRGYMNVELTPAKATCEWRFVAGVKQRSTALAGTKRISSKAGSHKLEI